jgi:hypothetical protein
MNLFAVRRKFLSYLPGQPRLFGQVAVRRIILAYGETTLCPPAIQLPNDMDGVTAVMEDTTPELERKRIAGGQYQHEPTVALEFTGVRLHLGSIYPALSAIVSWLVTVFQLGPHLPYPSARQLSRPLTTAASTSPTC